MDTTGAAPTADQARAQLATTQGRSLTSARDRRVHAVATATMGVTTTVYASAHAIISGAGTIALTVAFVVVLLGQGWWVERAARTAPRRSKTIALVGIITSLVLCLVAVLPWLNLSAQTSPVTWAMALSGAALAAVPALIAAAFIARRR